MGKSKFIALIIALFGIIAIAVINFARLPNHEHLKNFRAHTIPFTEDFSVRGSWIVFLVVAMIVLYFFFRLFNTMRARRGLNKRTNRY